ncbi:MAG TPA: murein biosynthesis integral membrane protein MurJ [Candidatus Polarisedimenticolaceae bacterium]|nr:murein biosynthesis integral membrane protein MurJ [Candidatus Polarisedimenticolaceae bacterium]
MSEERQVARHAGVVAAATMLSRVLGLVREQVMATLFGAGFATDAFNVAFRIPNLLRDLFAEGAMSSAFVPTFTGVLQHDGREAAWAFGRQLMQTLALVLAGLCVVGWIAAPWLVTIFAPGFSGIPGKLELTVQLTRVMLPFLPLVALAAVAMGMLNAHGRFAVPALAPALLNVGMVGGGLALIPVCRALGQPPIVAMAWGVVLGGLLQLGCQLPALSGIGFRPAFDALRRHPGVTRVAALMTPATIGLAATQLNLFVSTLIASLLVQGSVSWLWYAFRIMQLPIGVFGVALATVSLPALSRAAVSRDLPALKSTLSATLRLVFFLTAPAALWLAVMARPVIALLYEHGRFEASDTVQTANALVMYCVGLPAFAAVGVLTRAFYALGDTRTPVRASFVSVALNLVLNLLFVGPLRGLGLAHLGLALATSLTSIANLLQLGFYLRRRLGPLEGRRIAATFARVSAAAAAALAPCAVGLWALGERWHRGAVVEGAVVAGGVLLAGGVGFAALKLLRVTELETFESLIAERWRRRG